MPEGLVIPVVGDTRLQPMENYVSYRQVVGGYLEAVYLGPEMLMYVNEDGKHHRLPPNARATRLAWSFSLPADDFIVGDVVIVGRGTGEDEEEIPESNVQLLKAADLWPEGS
jgi:hypothetical protein